MKKILPIITVLFFAAMLFLTCFAQQIHNASLPHVTFIRPEQKLFPYEYADANGEIASSWSSRTVIPESLLDQEIYVIYSAEKNGTVRNYASLAPVVAGDVADGFVEIVSGINFSDKIVADSTGELFDGCEVIVLE